MVLIKYWRVALFLAGLFGAGILVHMIKESGRNEVKNEILREEKKQLKRNAAIDARPHSDPASLLKRMRANGF